MCLAATPIALRRRSKAMRVLWVVHSPLRTSCRVLVVAPVSPMCRPMLRAQTAPRPHTSSSSPHSLSSPPRIELRARRRSAVHLSLVRCFAILFVGKLLIETDQTADGTMPAGISQSASNKNVITADPKGSGALRLGIVIGLSALAIILGAFVVL